MRKQYKLINIKIDFIIFMLIFGWFYIFPTINYGFNTKCHSLYPISEVKGNTFKWGYIDCKGKVIIKPSFDYAGNFAENVGIIIKDSEGSGIVNLKGEIKFLPSVFIASESFSEGLIYGVTSKKAVYLDKTGKIKITLPSNVKFFENREVPNASSFKEGIASVMLNDGVTIFFNNTGNILFKGAFSRISDFNGSMATVNIDTSDEFFDKSKEALIDRSGRFIISPQNNNLWDPAGGLAKMKVKEGVWHFYNNKGKLLLECLYDFCGNFSEDLAIVSKNKKWGFIDKRGKVTIPLTFDKAEDFREGLASVKLNNKEGYINKRGRIVISPIFDFTNHFNNDFAYVKTSNEEGYIDKKGRWIWKRKSKQGSE